MKSLPLDSFLFPSERAGRVGSDVRRVDNVVVVYAGVKRIYSVIGQWSPGKGVSGCSSIATEYTCKVYR
jgi:hypothetical protein